MKFDLGHCQFRFKKLTSPSSAAGFLDFDGNEQRLGPFLAAIKGRCGLTEFFFEFLSASRYQFRFPFPVARLRAEIIVRIFFFSSNPSNQFFNTNQFDERKKKHGNEKSSMYYFFPQIFNLESSCKILSIKVVFYSCPNRNKATL